MIKKAVVLCGGMATRFMPFCKSIPKEMMPILDKPLLQYIIEDLASSGIKDILIVLGRNKECILNHFDRVPEIENRLIQTKKYEILDTICKPQNLANITFIKQLETKGTGFATLRAEQWVGDDDFYLTFGDELLFNNKKSIVKQMLDGYDKINQNLISVQNCDIFDVEKYGIIKTNNLLADLLQVEDIVEKPKIKDTPSNISYLGPAILKPEIFKYLKNIEYTGLELSLTAAFRELAKENKLFAKQIKGDRFDCGTVEGFLKANIYCGLKNKETKQKILNYFENFKKNSDK